MVNSKQLFAFLFSAGMGCMFFFTDLLCDEGLDGKNFFLYILLRDVKQATDPTFLRTEVNDPSI